MLRALFKLTKPGVLFGNVITAVAGYMVASIHSFHWVTFVAMLVGTTLVIAGACVLNNYLDQDIDAKMERTKTRPLVQGDVSPTAALVFCVLLTALGMTLLVAYTNKLVPLIGAIGFITYVWLYGAFTKRRSVHGTLVGSVSGALPILAGYVAASGRLDVGAVLVFAILFFWQEPEFYSIAIYRRKEYKTAGVPVISVIKGVPFTIRSIVVYTVLFVISTLLLSAVHVTGLVYFIIMLLVGIYWLSLTVKGPKTKDPDAWARKMFHLSINILLLFSILLCLERWLP